jgi:hypothetical protein
VFKRGTLVAVLIVSVSIVVIEQRKSRWAKAGREVSDAASAVGAAVAASPAESWNAARQTSQKAWRNSRTRTQRARQSGRRQLHQR